MDTTAPLLKFWPFTVNVNPLPYNGATACDRPGVAVDKGLIPGVKKASW